MRVFTRLGLASYALLLSIPSLAFDPEIEKTPSGRLILRADSCQTVQSQIRSFEQWIAWKGDARCATPTKTGDACQADITQCVPEHVVKYQNATPSINGPNCWNLALVMKGILPYLGHASEEEMTFYMSSPLCKKIKTTEKPRPGDIGAIRSGASEIHAFIHVSDLLAYSKNGGGSQAPYLLQPRAAVFEEYPVGKLASDNDLTYFRCQSMDEYLSRRTSRRRELQPLLRATRLVEQIECRTSLFLLDSTEFKTEHRNEIAQIGKVLASYLESELTAESYHPSQDPTERFVLGSLALRVEQINNDLKELENRGAYTGQWTSQLDSILPTLMQKAFDELR